MITVHFDDFFERRRQYNVEVDCEDRGTFYLCQLTLPNTSKLYTEVAKNTEQGDLFESTYLPRCNKAIFPGAPSLATHNFSEPLSWIPKTINAQSDSSLFVWSPDTGKKLILREIFTSCWHELTFDTGQKIKFVVWESMYGTCPTTDFITPTPFNDGPSWLKVWPALNYAGPANFPAQEVAIYVYLTNQGVPLYKATEFTYASLADISRKARKKDLTLKKKNDPVLGDVYESVSWYPYYDQGVNIVLRSSMNERVEVFINNDTPLDNSTSDVPSIAVGMFLSYDEW